MTIQRFISGKPLCMAAVLAFGASFASAATLFQDSFDQYYDSGAASSKKDTHLNPANWVALGNANYSTVDFDNDGVADGYVTLNNGTAKNQTAVIRSTSTDLGFNSDSDSGTRYQFHVGDANRGSGNGNFRFTILGGGAEQWYSATSAVQIVVTKAYAGLQIKNNGNGNNWSATDTLWSTNYTSGGVESVDLVLTATGYTLTLNGLDGAYSPIGALSGTISWSDVSAFDHASVTFGLQQPSQDDQVSNPFQVQVKDVTVSSVPEPGSAALLSLGGLLLLRRRRVSE